MRIVPVRTDPSERYSAGTYQCQPGSAPHNTGDHIQQSQSQYCGNGMGRCIHLSMRQSEYRSHAGEVIAGWLRIHTVHRDRKIGSPVLSLQNPKVWVSPQESDASYAHHIPYPTASFFVSILQFAEVRMWSLLLLHQMQQSKR